jgi:hypothetical protein
MAVSRCPHCNDPLLEEEATGPACPSCGTAFVVPETPPPPPPPPPSSPQPWGLISAVAALSVLSLALWLTRPPSGPVEESAAYKALLEEKENAETALARARARQKKQRAEDRAALEKAKKELTGQLAAEVSKRQDAELKANQAVAKMGALDKRASEAERDLAEERRLAGKQPDGTLKLQNPSGQHRIEALNDKQVVKLSGRISTLRIKSVDGDAVLDASKLEAKWVFIEGPIGGKARVRLNAPMGTVMVSSVAGTADVEIAAPGGRATITKVNGGPKITLQARYVSFGTINGTTTNILATVSSGGILNFRSLLGTSKLFWRREKPTDLPPKGVRGPVAPGAVFEEKN